MLRRLLHLLSEREGVRDVLLRLPFSRRTAYRFVAGESMVDALDAARELNDDGFRVTLDHLGESVSDRQEARRATREYVRSLDAIHGSPARATISLKLTQLGLDIDTGFCEENLRRILSRAREVDSFVRIDMEGSDYTQRTLDVFHSVFAEFDNVGAVIQSYLRRSEQDVLELVECGAPVRLCKGAYREPPEVAFQDRERVDANYVRLMKLLLEGGAPTAIATHDERMIRSTLEFARERGVADEAWELQMLYGVRREYQRELVDRGHAMRIYVPYGSEWYPYLMRRMAERPANLWFAVRAMLGG